MHQEPSNRVSTRRLKHVATLTAGGTPRTDEPDYWSDDSGIPWVAIADMSDGRMVFDTAKRVTRAGMQAARLPVAGPGTVLLAMYATVGAAAPLGIRASWNQAILGITPIRDRAESRFVRYWLDSIRATWPAVARSNTQDNIGAEIVADAHFPDVTFGNQAAIADYLDAETAHIDAGVRACERQLGLLTERKQQTISAAFAGVQTTVPVRRVVTALTSGPRGWSGLEVEEPGPIFLRIANVPDDSITLKLDSVSYLASPTGPEAARCRAESGDVLTTITAAIGQVAMIPDDLGEAYVSQHLALMRPDRRLVRPEWLAWALKSDDVQRQFEIARYGGTKQQLALEDVADIRIPLATVEDQTSLLRATVEATRRIEQAERRVRAVGSLLLERRQALITAAVTGQIDIPGVAA